MTQPTTCGCNCGTAAPKKKILVYACSGAANVGQVANRAAVDLQQEGFAKMLCLAAIGGNVPSMIELAKAGKQVVGIDGCPVACTQKTMERAQLSLTHHIVVTELGFKKAAFSGTIDEDMLGTVKQTVRDKVSATCAERSNQNK